MKSRVSLFFIVAIGIIALGCQSDQDESAASTGEVQAAETREASTSDDPEVRTVRGTLSGFDCAVVGQLCPSTHRGGDYTTGLFTEDESFYFVANIPNSFLTQYFLETVEVKGTVYPPYNHAVEPEVIHVVEEDQRRLVYEEGYFIDEEGQRATFHEGQFQDGRWIVP